MAEIRDLDFMIDESLPGMTCFTEAGYLSEKLYLYLTVYFKVYFKRKFQLATGFWFRSWLHSWRSQVDFLQISRLIFDPTDFDLFLVGIAIWLWIKRHRIYRVGNVRLYNRNSESR